MLIEYHQSIVKLLREMVDCQDSSGLTCSTFQQQSVESSTEKSNPSTLQEIDKKDKLFSIDYACRYLGIVRSTLARLREEGHLTDIKKGRSVRFRFGELKKIRKWYSIPKGKV